MFALLLALAAAPSTDETTILKAFDAIRAGRPAEAIAVLDPVIARYDAAAARDTRTTYCAITPSQTVAYMAMAAAAKQRNGAVAVDRSYCQALFFKGFALVDLGKVEEAQAVYRKRMALAPLDPHGLTEYGQTLRIQKDWAGMLAACTTAEQNASLGTNEKLERGLALRCQGFALIEQGKWDEAEARYRACLKLDPTDAKAKNELQYIAEQRRKRPV